MAVERHKFPRGVGIGLRRPHFAAIPTTQRTIDWFEIVPENFVGRGGNWVRTLHSCRERCPMAAHGVSLSLGGPDPLDRHYLRALKGLLDAFEIPVYTDHLCFVSIAPMSSYDLLPLPFNEDAIRHAARRIVWLQDFLERPVAVENISYYATMPQSDLSEGEFVRGVVEEARCGLLLDVNNVYVNAKNHGRTPQDVLWELPVERAWQVHVAGHRREDGRLLDDHGAPVEPEVWELLHDVIAAQGEISVLLEWDSEIPALDRVLDEADIARQVVARALVERDLLERAPARGAGQTGSVRP